MGGKTVEAKVVEAFGREFVQGNVPEINEVRCMGCSHCAVLCKKLGPNVLDIKGGIAVAAANPCGAKGRAVCRMQYPEPRFRAAS